MIKKNRVSKFIAGIDIGTTNIKGSLYSSDGELLDRASYEYKSFSPEKNFHEQNPGDWINGLKYVLKSICKTSAIRENFMAMSISTQGGTVVPVDKDFNPLCNAITWLDRRGEEIYEKEQELREKNIDFYMKTGWRLDTHVSFMPLFWLKENKKNVFKNIHKVLYVNDFLIHKLTGNNYQDPSNASITLFYNVKEGKWDKEILKLIGLGEKHFSQIRESGEIAGFLNSEISGEIGFGNKVAVVNGGHDQYCSAVGAGIFDCSEILLATGTAWVVFKMTDEPLMDKEHFFAAGRNIIKGKYGLIYTIPAAGASINWLALNVMNLGSEKELFELVDKNAGDFNNIKNNIIFHPYLTGNFGPGFNISQKASFLNLEIGHNYTDLMKAIMEGVAFQLKKILAVFKEKGIDVNRIKMVGGGTKSRVWPGLISDVTGKEILISKDRNDDYATKGAAIIAGYGVGIFKSPEYGFKKMRTQFDIIKPKKNDLDYYGKKYLLFQKYN
ncbi:MAG: hypothetical protein JW770_05360 [Actinobacteria bacterium]|nr:hypothetical protein [Actinomycetota bacterium]